MAVSHRSLQAWFGDHWLRGLPRSVRTDAEPQLIAIRALAEAILNNTPAGPEQSRAVTRLRDQWDQQLLAAWEAHLPAHESLLNAWWGEHWIKGFREEDQAAASRMLGTVREVAQKLGGGDSEEVGKLQDIRDAWMAAMRALRCFT